MAADTASLPLRKFRNPYSEELKACLFKKIIYIYLSF